MIHWKRNVFLLAFCISGTSASYTMLVPFLPLYLLDLGTPSELVTVYSGAVFSVTFLVAAIMAPIWGKMADTKGKKVMAVRACAALTVTYFIGGLVTSPQQLFGMRVLQGFANGFLPMVLAMASASAPRKQLGYALGIVQTGQIIGSVLGPLMGGAIAELVGMRSSFFVASGFLLLVTLMVAVFAKEPVVKQVVTSTPQDKTTLWEDFCYAFHNRSVLAMLVLAFIICMANMILQPIISLYVAQLQHSMENVAFTSGFIFSLGGIAGILSTTTWGRLGQHRSYYFVLALSFCGAGLFNFLQYFPTSIIVFAMLQFFFGLFFMGANPAVNAILVTATPTNFRGRVFGLSTMANQLGFMAGPLAGGAISMVWGIRSVFLITGSVLFTIGIFLWLRMRRVA